MSRHSQRSLDTRSPLPLFHQIAEAIRERIRAGDLAPGDRLESLRQGAWRWGVNLHTIRHAYSTLAREGLISMGKGRAGARVRRTPLPAVPPDPRQIDSFLDRVRREAREGLGLGTRDLVTAVVERFGDAAATRPAIWIVECSEWQCRCHAREIEERWNVDARTWPLTTRGEPPGEPVIATLFHYNDIRTLWPETLATITFVALQPDPSLRQSLSAPGGRALVFEREASRAAAVIADLQALFRGKPVLFEPLVADRPGDAFPLDPSGPPVLFSPRTWAALDEAGRSHPRAVEIRYLIERRDLERLGVEHGWSAVRSAV